MPFRQRRRSALRRMLLPRHREEHTPAAFGLAMLPTFLLGSLGCGCIGFTGVFSMAGALLLTSIPEMVRWALASQLSWLYAGPLAW